MTRAGCRSATSTWPGRSTGCSGDALARGACRAGAGRQSGEEIDLFGWLGAARIDGADADLPEPLRALVLAAWPGDAAACAEAAAEAEYWMVGLAREGLILAPDLPHVATACEERVTVAWTELAPFLAAEGRAGLARLLAE